jgi:anti-anti-sigma regulatory factor
MERKIMDENNQQDLVTENTTTKKNSPQNLWHRLTAPHATDRRGARREYATKVISVVLGAMSVLLALFSTIGWLAGAPVPTPFIPTIPVVLAVLWGFAWWLANRGYVCAGGCIPIIVFFLFALVTNYIEGRETSAPLLYVAAILFAAMLQGGRVKWVVLGLSVVAYLGLSQALAHELLPPAPVSKERFALWELNVTISLLGITLLQWFYAGQYRDALGQLEQEVFQREQAQEESVRLQEQVIEAQQQAIKELSTPVIPIMEAPDGSGSVIAIPLIGSIDSMRARDITRALLTGISKHRATVVILDMTGVGIVDTGVVNHLNKTIQATRLKGAHTIITGISDAVAEAIVDLGIDWSGVTTLSDLQSGLMMALKNVGLKLDQA